MMNRMRGRRLLAVALAFVLAGCGAESDDQPDSEGQVVTTTSGEPLTLPPTTTSASPTPTRSSPPTSDRGLIVKTLGEDSGYGYPDPDRAGEFSLKFILDAIEVDPGCTSPDARVPSLGHFIVLSLRFSTAPDMDAGVATPYFFDPGDWHVIGPDGVRENENDTVEAFTCLNDSELIPREPIGPGTQLVGKIVLDASATSGLITYTPPAISNAGGWEWTF